MKAVAFLLLLGLGAATRCSEGGQDGQEGQEGPSDSSEMAPEELARPRIVLVGQTGAGKYIDKKQPSHNNVSCHYWFFISLNEYWT